MRIYFFLLFFILGSSAFAQNLSRSVIASGGNYQVSTEGQSLSWTLGELSTEYLQDGPSIQQGFQQAQLDMTVGISSAYIPPSAWRVFPNPTAYFLQLETNFEDTWVYELQDILGRQLLRGTSTAASQRLDLPSLKAGIYLITVRDQIGRTASRKLFINQN